MKINILTPPPFDKSAKPVGIGPELWPRGQGMHYEPLNTVPTSEPLPERIDDAARAKIEKAND